MNDLAWIIQVPYYCEHQIFIHVIRTKMEKGMLSNKMARFSIRC